MFAIFLATLFLDINAYLEHLWRIHSFTVYSSPNPFQQILTMSRKITIAILCFSFIPMLLAAGWTAYSAACGYERKTGELTDRLHAMPRVKSLLKKAGEFVTLGVYKGHSKEIEELNAIVADRKSYQQQAAVATITFFLISGVFLAFIHVFVSSRSLFTGAMLIVSSIALAVGLAAPILMIITYKDITLLGRMVFLFQSKGILTTIETLFNSGNILVAVPLFLFSVMVPFFKTIVMGVALLARDHQSSFAGRSLDIIRRIGKWSMADVFVVSLLLTYFTINKDRFTNAEVQIGLYFFMGYVILSMIASYLLTHSGYMKSPPNSPRFEKIPW